MRQNTIMGRLNASLRQFLLALAITMMAACQPNIAPTTLETIADDGVLRVGTLYGRTSFYQGPNGPAGFEYELSAGFADYLGVTLEVYPFYSLTDLKFALRQNHLDVIALGQPLYGEHIPEFLLGPAYQYVDQHVIFRQGETWPRALSELASPILVPAESQQAYILLNINDSPSSPTIEWHTVDDQDSQELLASVATGEIAYTVTDSNTLALQRRRFPQLSIAMTIAEQAPVAWLVNNGSDQSLQASLFEYFDLIRRDSSFAILNEKYFGHVQQFDYVDTRVFIESVKTQLPLFKDWFKRYSGDIDWRLLAALSYQESHWDPNARSNTGVRGLMMLTRATAKDMGIPSRIDPEQSIRGGANYFASLLSRIPARIQSPDRVWMALAAYNIGLGHLEDARVLTQRQGGDPDLWIDVKQRLPLLNQKRYYQKTKYGFAHGDVAKRYVENIRRYYDTLIWLEQQTLPAT